MQNGRSKTKTIIASVLVLLAAAVAGYIYFAKKKLFPQTAARSSSFLDITPLLVAKLQQMVLQSSDSLYQLSVEQLQPDILSLEVQALHVTLTPDSTVLARLDKARRAPDDVFTLSFDTLRITGISPTDFLRKTDIHLDTIFLSSPRIHIIHTSRPYNAAIRKQDSTETLYHKLSQQFSSLSIGAIVARNGNVISTNLSQKTSPTELKKVSLRLSNIRIDSLTQHDTSRFLFSKAADFTFRDYVSMSADSQYVFKLGSVSVSANQRRLTVKGFSYEPNGGKAAFEKRLKTRNDMYIIRFPDIVADGIDWWALANRQSLYAGTITLNGGLVKDYFDRSLPSSGKPTSKDNYPHQMLTQLSVPVLVENINIKGVDVSYEEFNPGIQKSGTVTFNNITGSIRNITNVPSRIKATPQSTSSLTGLFMNQVPITAAFGFNLARARTGNFTGRFHLNTVTNTLLNTIAEPLGLYTLTSGTIDETTVSIAGDNYTSTTSITMLYHDLRMFPLKVTGNGKTKKQGIAGFIANTFLIKDANPAGKSKEPRHPDVPVVRDPMGGSFFNFLWQSILTGIVETVGLPKKFADQ